MSRVALILTHHPVDELVSRLEGVRRQRHGWRAPCPACGGKSAKLSVAEADNGSALLHCFAGCTAIDVLGAVGLQLSDLFPKRLEPMSDAERRDSRRRHREVGFKSAMAVLSVEAMVVLAAVRQIASSWEPLSDEDEARLALAVDRIDDVKEVFDERL